MNSRSSSLVMENQSYADTSKINKYKDLRSNVKLDSNYVFIVNGEHVSFKQLFPSGHTDFKKISESPDFKLVVIREKDSLLKYKSTSKLGIVKINF